METQQPDRKQWLVVTLALTVAPILYYIVIQLVGVKEPSPLLPTLRLVAFPLALVMLVVGTIVVRRSPRADISNAAPTPGAALAVPGQFQLRFLIGCAMFEMSCVMGFVLVMLGGSLRDYVPLGAASLAAMLGVALPTGLRYWSERERLGSGGSAPLR